MSGRAVLDALARTGRTTRMVMEACRLAREGRKVVVLADNRSDEANIKNIASMLHGGSELVISTPMECRFAFHDWRSPGFGPDVLYFLDHRLLEMQFCRVLEAFHDFDDVEPNCVPELTEGQKELALGLANALNDYGTDEFEDCVPTSMRLLRSVAGRMLKPRTSEGFADWAHRVHKDLGAPGDYGYESPLGKALYAIYREAMRLGREGVKA